MTKKELVDVIAEVASDLHVTYGKKIHKVDVEAMLAALGKVAAKALAFGDEVPLSGIGMLVAKSRKASKARNPRTGAEITIPACKVVRLRVTKHLKDAVNR